MSRRRVFALAAGIVAAALTLTACDGSTVNIPQGVVASATTPPAPAKCQENVTAVGAEYAAYIGAVKAGVAAFDSGVRGKALSVEVVAASEASAVSLQKALELAEGGVGHCVLNQAVANAVPALKNLRGALAGQQAGLDVGSSMTVATAAIDAIVVTGQVPSLNVVPTPVG